MHTLIVGQTECGKTTFMVDFLLKQYAQNPKCEGILIYDKRFSGSPRWKEHGGSKVETFNDLTAFKDRVLTSVNCAVVMEECGAISIAEQENVADLAAMGRHLGHNMHFMAQRSKMIRPNLRSQTSCLACFLQSPDDATELRGDFHKIDKEAVAHLPKGRGFFQISKFGEPFEGRVF